MQPRIMYIECKAGGLNGPARIGRVTFSRSGRTIYYQGRRFRPLRPCGYKCNYEDAETGDPYWISGCKRRGGDRLYSGLIEIDDDAREEYWTGVRGIPENADQSMIRCTGKYPRG